MDKIKLNVKFNYRTPRRVFLNMYDFKLKVILTSEFLICNEARFFIKCTTRLDVSMEEFDLNAIDGSDVFVLTDLIRKYLQLKEKMLKLIKSYSLYDSYILFQKNYNEWEERYRSRELKPSNLNGHLIIIRK
jgi:hypothetical protein